MSNYYVTAKSAILLPGRIVAVPGQEVEASIFDGERGQSILQRLLDSGHLRPFQTTALDPSGLVPNHGVRAGVVAGCLPPLPVETEDTKIQGVAKPYGKVERKLAEIKAQQAAREAEAEKAKAPAPKTNDWKARKLAAKKAQLAEGGPEDNELSVADAKALGLLK